MTKIYSSAKEEAAVQEHKNEVMKSAMNQMLTSLFPDANKIPELDDVAYRIGKVEELLKEGYTKPDVKAFVLSGNKEDLEKLKREYTFKFTKEGNISITLEGNNRKQCNVSVPKNQLDFIRSM